MLLVNEHLRLLEESLSFFNLVFENGKQSLKKQEMLQY